ncbi:MAG: LamG domain-containing protein [Bdellovibrionales bacterium]
MFWRPKMSRFAYLTLLTLLFFNFQNCSEPSKVAFSSSNKPKINSENNGDGYMGKPPAGDYVRSHLNYRCTLASSTTLHTQGLLQVGDTSSTMTDDNCQNYSYGIDFGNPNFDYVPYNTDFIGFNAAIYERKSSFEAQPNSAVDVFCRQADMSAGLDVVVKIDPDLRASAKIYKGQESGGTWTSRVVPSFLVQRSISSTSARYQTSGFDLNVNITNSAQLTFAANLNATIDGLRVDRSMTCRRTRPDSALPASNDGRVALWQMNSSLIDISGFSNDIVAIDPGGTLGYAAGIYDNSLQTDGNTITRLQVAPSPSLNNLQRMSLTLWVWPNDNGFGLTDGGLIHKSQGVLNVTQGWKFFIGASTRRLGFEVAHSGGNLWVTSGSDIAVDAWNHVAITWDGSNRATGVRIYVNGNPVVFGTTVDGLGTRLDDATLPLYLADTSDDSSGHLSGRLDQTTIWNRVLSAAEVLQISRTGAPTP